VLNILISSSMLFTAGFTTFDLADH